MKYIYRQRINFYDCDPAGIMFYGNVYRLCHSAYESMIGEIMSSDDYWNSKSFVVPIIKTEASYHKPLLPGETAVVELEITQLKASSFELSYNCLNSKNEICVKVKTVHVFVDKRTWEKIKIPDAVSRALKKFTADQTSS